MKRFIVVALLAMAAVGTFTGCEKKEYRHPLHRN